MKRGTWKWYSDILKHSKTPPHSSREAVRTIKTFPIPWCHHHQPAVLIITWWMCDSRNRETCEGVIFFQSLPNVFISLVNHNFWLLQRLTSVRLQAAIPNLCQEISICAFFYESYGINVILSCQLTKCRPSVNLHNQINVPVLTRVYHLLPVFWVVHSTYTRDNAELKTQRCSCGDQGSTTDIYFHTLFSLPILPSIHSAHQAVKSFLNPALLLNVYSPKWI